MNETHTTSTSDPRQSAASFGQSLESLVQDLRESSGKTEEAKAQALFETAAEVLSGLRTAFEHYAGQAERAMAEQTPALDPRSPRQENL